MNATDKKALVPTVALPVSTVALEKSALEQRSREIRGYCSQVEKIIIEEGMLTEVQHEMQKEIPNLVPIEGESNPVPRLLKLFRGVGNIARRAANMGFDTVVNPCSGSDISAGVSLGCDKLVMIDNGDLFAILDSTKEKLSGRLKRLIRGKLVTGMHTFSSNQGLAAFGMELILLGADVQSIQVIRQESVGRNTLTEVQFSVGNRKIKLINISNYTLKSRFDETRQNDSFVRAAVESLLKEANNPLILSKAGGSSLVGKNISTSALYTIAPEHTVIVSDSNEEQAIEGSGTSVRLHDLKTQTILDDLNKLQGGPPPESMSFDGRTDPRLSYGYAIDLRDLVIAEVRK